MGKKTKKTRWRTLSIGGAHSDSESHNDTNNESTKINHKYSRINEHTNGAWYKEKEHYYNKYSSSYSSNSTPIKHQNGGSHHHHHHQQQQQQQQRTHWNPYYHRNSHQETSKSTTRSSSTVSEHKITFNEDEYTRITTPRQDVLFKKGYLSKPKPHLQQQRSLTSTGNSTGDGTPDHQSADGTELTDNEYDQSPFIFPGGYLDAGNSGMFFVNGFEPYAVPPHHVLVYDQYGNAAVCFPPAPSLAPPQLPPPPTVFERRAKRYSTDSMTESASPHNEETTSTFNDSDESFIVNESPFIIKESEGEKNVTTTTTNEELTSRKKRRRNRNIESKTNNEHLELSSDLSSLSDDNNDEDKQQQNNNENESIEDGDDDNDEQQQQLVINNTNCKYRVDAEEFVPRSYRTVQPMEFISLPIGIPFPPEIYAGAFVPATMFVPPPPPPTHHQIFYNHHPQQQQQQQQQHIIPANNELILHNENQKTVVDDDTEKEESIKPIESEPVTAETVVNCKIETDDEQQQQQQQQQQEKEEQQQPQIDIAKIVSKLEEQAAFEQKVNDKFAQNKNENETIEENTVIPKHKENVHVEQDIKINKTEKKLSTMKTSRTNGVKQQYSERLKQSQTTQQSKREQLIPNKTLTTTTPPPSLIKSQQHTTTKSKRFNNIVATPCPRLERNARQNSDNNCTANTTTATITTSTTSTTTSIDQWISVSAKKKRGRNKQSQSEQNELIVEQQFPPIVSLNEKMMLNKINKTENDHIVPVQSQVIETNQTCCVDKEICSTINNNSKRDRSTRTNNNSKKQSTIKKRIIIYEGQLTTPPNNSSNNNSNNKNQQTTEVVAINKMEKPEQTVVVVVKENHQVLEKKKNNSIETISKEPSQELTIITNKPSKKKKKNKSKPILNIDEDDIIIPTEIISDDSDRSDNVIVNNTETNFDVSLELDRMIQRGLYGNLEQRLRSFNPSDSFIVDVINQQQPDHSNTTTTTNGLLKTSSISTKKSSGDLKRFDTAAAAAASTTTTTTNSVIGTMASAVLKKPASIFGQNIFAPTLNGFIAPKLVVTTKDEINTTTSRKNTIRKDSVRTCSESSNSSSCIDTPSMINDENSVKNARFPITRAVKEWMHKTRENTPEVEIFKKPNVIRQEFHMELTDDDDDDEVDKKFKLELELECNEATEIQEENLTEKMVIVGQESNENRFNLMLRSSRSSATREPNAVHDDDLDLLECWEPDICLGNKSLSSMVTVASDETGCKLNQIEQGEEALETYQSVYGQSDDYGRIQREILEQQQQQLQAPQQQQQQSVRFINNNNLRGVDGALPYRAICCSIM